MTAEIVNLRKARKAKAKVAKERQAEENRVRFGRTKGQKVVEDFDRARRNGRSMRRSASRARQMTSSVPPRGE